MITKQQGPEGGFKYWTWYTGGGLPLRLRVLVLAQLCLCLPWYPTGKTMYLWLTSSDRSDVVSPRHDLVWSQACLVYDRTCCWFHLMGFLIWGFIMFSWCMVEMTWDC